MRSHKRFSMQGLWVVGALAGLAGCGGGGRAVKNSQTSADAARQSRLVRFDVDVKTGKVTITPPDTGRAVFNGSAVSFTSSDLLAVTGDSGQRKIHVRVTNNSGQAFTGTPRLVVEGLTNGVSSSFYRQATLFNTYAGYHGNSGTTDGNVSFARFMAPASVAAGSGAYAGTYYIADRSANNVRKMTSDGGVGTLLPAGTLNAPEQVAVDGSGNVFVADAGNHVIRRISPLGVCSIVAGLSGTSGNVDGGGSAARFSDPIGVAVSQDGNRVYVADTGNAKIRYISFVGTDRTVSTSYSVSTLSLTLISPYNVALTADVFGSEVLFVADHGANKVRRIANPSGSPTMSTIAGTGTAGIHDDTGDLAQFNGPRGIAAAINEAGEPVLFVTDDHAVRAVLHKSGSEPSSPGDYNVVTLGGSTTSGVSDDNGLGASLTTPSGLCAIPADGSSATLFVAEADSQIRKVTVASGFLKAGDTAGAGEPVRLVNWDAEVPNRVAWSKDLTAANETDLQFYVPLYASAFTFSASVESDSDTVNLPAKSATVLTTVAGDGLAGAGNGPGKLAEFSAPVGVAAVPTELQSVYGFPVRGFVADTANNCIRAVDTSGNVTLFAGNPGSTGSPTSDDDGVGSLAKFNHPRGVAVGPDGSVYVADTGASSPGAYSHKVRRIAPDGTVTTILKDETGANVGTPYGIAVDAGGTVFFTDQSKHVVQRLYCVGDPTLATSYTRTVVTEGSALTGPTGIVCDSDGTIYVADTANQTICRLVRSAGATMTVSIWAGVASTAGDYDTSGGVTALFDGPSGISVDRAHNLYVTDRNKHRVRRISPLRTVLTLIGNGNGIGSGFVDGAWNAAKFNHPEGLSVESSGSLLVADTDSNSIRCVQRVVDTAVAQNQ